jgi:hypothetical protein
VEATHSLIYVFFKSKRYHDLKDEWCGIPDVFDRPDILEERHRIDVDCRRTDRNQPLFSSAPASTSVEADGLMRHSTISPNMSDIGAQSPSNEHIDRLAGILLTYNFFDKELGSFPFLRLQALCLLHLYFTDLKRKVMSRGCRISVLPCTSLWPQMKS